MTGNNRQNTEAGGQLGALTHGIFRLITYVPKVRVFGTTVFNALVFTVLLFIS